MVMVFIHRKGNSHSELQLPPLANHRNTYDVNTGKNKADQTN